jgi:hypothetical protein
MKKYLVFSLFVFSQTISAQDFPGYRAGNYTGVNGVFYNPANIADSRYRWDFNLFSLSTSVGNNQASFRFKNIGNTFKGDSLINQFIGKDAGAASGMVSANIHGPSVMFNTGKKAAVAFTSRARIMMNAIDIDGKLVDKITNGPEADPGIPYSINSSQNMRVSLNAWSEFGLSYGRILKEEGKHFFKGGITVKYLAGVANGYLNIDKLKATIDEDPVTEEGYLQNASGRLQLGLGGINISDFDVDKLTSFQSTGFGGDIGFVYEFRPDHEKYKLDSNSWRRDLNKYKFRIGLALLDIGSVKYERDIQRSGAYDINVAGTEKLYLGQFDDVEIDSLKKFFDNNPQYFTPATGNNEKNYKVGLPTTLHIDADYHFHRGFYVNLSGQLSLVNTKNKPYNSQYYSSFSLTPRYEGRAIGLYVPLSYNKLTNFNAGISLRMGPLFIGSGSVLTALISDSKQADVYVGLRFGGLQKDQVKKSGKKEKKTKRKAAKDEEKQAEKSVKGDEMEKPAN